MEQLLEEVKLHKHICFGIDNYVTLGVVRSLGEAGIMPVVILHKHNPIHLVIHLPTGSIWAILLRQEKTV